MKVSRYVLLVLPFIFLASILPILSYAADQNRQALENLLEDLEKKINEADQRMVAHPKFLEELRALVKQYRSMLQEPLHARRIEGQWLVNNNNPGKLEFHWTGNAWTGRIWFDAHQRWEDLKEVSFDSHTGKVQFLRTIGSERFYGTVSGRRITGTFTYGASTYPWEAKRP